MEFWQKVRGSQILKKSWAARLFSVSLKSKQQRVLAAWFTVLVFGGGMLENFERSMLRNLSILLIMHVMPIWLGIAYHLKFKI